MNITCTRQLILGCLLVLLFSTQSFAQPPCPANWEPSNLCGNIQAQGGPAPGSPIIFCEGETVTVINNSSPPNEITYTYIDWGDGLCQSYPGKKDTMLHAYDFPNDTCIGGSGQITFIVRLGIEKVCGDQSSFHYITFPIAVRFKPVSDFSFSPVQPCVGTQISLSDSSCPNSFNPNYSWTIDGNAADTSANTKVTFTQSGIHTLELTVSNECGTSTNTLTANVLDPPIANVDITSGVTTASGTPIVCVGDDGSLVVFNGLNSEFETSYKWTVSPAAGANVVGPSDSSVFTVLLTLDTLYTVILTVDNPCMEPGKDTVLLQGINAAELRLDAFPDTCSMVEYTPSPFVSDADYFVNGVLINGFPIQLDTGTYIVNAALNNECGDQFQTDTFHVYPATLVAIQAPANLDTICLGGAAVPLEANLSDVVWEVNGVQVTTFEPQDTGLFLVKAIFGAGACRSEDSVMLVVQGILPTTMDVLACPGVAAVPLQGSPPGGSWDFPACPACIQNDSFFFAGYNGNFPVTVDYWVDDGICPSASELVIEIVAPEAGFQIAGPVCAGVPVDVNATTAIADTLIWLLDGADAGLPPFPGQAAGTYSLMQIALLGDCRDTLVQDLLVLAPPEAPGITASEPVGCSPFSVAFAPTGTENLNTEYNWIFIDGNPTFANSWMPPDSVSFVNNTSEILYFPVILSAENFCGNAADTLLIQVNPVPVADLGLDSLGTGCSPLEVVITNRSSAASDSCVLRISNGSVIAPFTDFVTDTFYAINGLTHYQLQLQAFNACGMAEYVDTITVLPPGIDAFFEIDDETVCTNTAVNFFDASVPVPTTIQWDFGDGTFSNLPDPSHVYELPNQTFEVTLRVSTGCGFDTIKHQIKTLDEPGVNFAVPPFGCEDLLVKFENRSSPDLLAYYWQYSDGGTDSTHFHGLHAFEQAGEEYQVQLTVVDWNGCTNTMSREIAIEPKPVVGFYVDVSEGCPPLDVHFVDTSRNVDSWEWVFDDGTRSFDQHPGKLFDIGNYSVKLIASKDGVCIDSAFVTDVVQVEVCDAYIPNVFAPSSNGRNAIFTVFGSSALESIDILRVYDYWGELVYEGIELPPDNITGWDGNFRGKPMNPAVFVYYAELRFTGGEIKRFKGDVTLVR